MGWIRNKIFLLLVAVGAAIALLISLLPVQEWFGQIQNWLTTLGPWAVPAFVLVYLLVTIIGLPNILLMLIAGTLFGLIKGIVSVSVADTLGAVACYGLGRTIARGRVKKMMANSRRLVNLDRAVEQQGWKILLLARLSPVVPSNVLNYGFSFTKVNFWQYLFCSWLGMLPVIFFYISLGSFGYSLMMGDNSPGKIVLQAGGLAATVAAAVYVTNLVKNILSEPEHPEDEQNG